MVVGDELVLSIKSGCEAIVIIGPVNVVLNVLFPTPDNLHGPLDLPGDGDGLRDAVHVETASKAPADNMVVNLDLLGWQAGDFRRRSLCPAHDLNAYPDFAAVFRHMHRAVHRLHGGMGEKWHLVDGFDFLRRGRKGLRKVPIGAGDNAIVLRGPRHLLDDALGRDVGIRTFVPLDVKRLKPLHRRPHVVAHHCDGVVDAHHLPHARDCQGLAVVHALDFAAEHRACGDGRKLHSRHHRVDAELGLAVHLLWRVDPLGRRPDQGELFRRLEPDLVGNRQLGCRLDQRAVFQPLPGRRDHVTFLGPARRRIDAPLRRGRLDQHHARGRTGAAQRLPKSRHRCRPAGNLKPEQGVGIKLVVWRGGLDADLL